jgi:cell division transport system permease protein
MAAFRYALEEAAASLWRGRRSGLLSTGVIAIALFVLGGFLGLTANLERIADEWRQAAEMSVFLTDDVTEADRRAIEAALAPGAVVASVEYISKAEALARFKQMFGDLAPAADALEANPLPASFEVRLRPASQSGGGLEALAATLRQTPGVSDVRYDRQWLDRVASAISLVRRVGIVLGAMLTLAAALTVANVVRLALHARRDEIEIMELVGAPPAYIRGPFVMEGVLQGGLGAAVALAALAAAFLALRRPYLTPLAAALNVSPIRFLSLEVCVYLLLGGMIVGCLGGLLAARSRP